MPGSTGDRAGREFPESGELFRDGGELTAQENCPREKLCLRKEEDVSEKSEAAPVLEPLEVLGESDPGEGGSIVDEGVEAPSEESQPGFGGEEDALPVVALNWSAVSTLEIEKDDDCSGPDSANTAVEESPVMLEALEHGSRVADLAEKIFDGTESLHGLGRRWKNRLLTAARLHDIGAVQGEKGHHKRSMNMILENPCWVRDEEDRRWVALLARYHRKSEPRNGRRSLQDMEKKDLKILRQLTAILRAADALDYAHQGHITDLSVKVRRASVLLELVCPQESDATEEIWRLERKGRFFAEVFERRLKALCRPRSIPNSTKTRPASAQPKAVSER